MLNTQYTRSSLTKETLQYILREESSTQLCCSYIMRKGFLINRKNFNKKNTEIISETITESEHTELKLNSNGKKDLMFCFVFFNGCPQPAQEVRTTCIHLLRFYVLISTVRITKYTAEQVSACFYLF